MKKLVIILTIALVISLFVPSPSVANKPGRVQQLEDRVRQLENKLQDYDTLKMEVSNLESIVNFILSGDFANMVCQSCD